MADTPNNPNNPNEPEFTSSLGVDPSDEPRFELPSEEAEGGDEGTDDSQGSDQGGEDSEGDSGEPEAPEGLTAEQKAAFYDSMAADAELVNVIENYYDNKRKGLKTPATPQPQGQESDDSDDDDPLAQIRKENEDLKRAIYGITAHLKVQDFQQRNPDFNEYRSEVGQLIKKHPSMDIEEAYNLAKLAKTGNGRAQAPREKPNPQVAEGRTGGLPPSRQEIDDQQILKAKTTDEAVDLAFRRALMEQQKGS